MKCRVPDCPEEATVYIGEVTNRSLGQQQHLCECHAGTQMPFSAPGGFSTSLGTGLLGGLNRFEVQFVVFFTKHESAALYLREVSGSKRFALPVGRYEGSSIIQALQRTTGSRLLTFAVFWKIVETLGGKLEEVIVDELEKHGEFYCAKLKFRQDNRLAMVDARPSDAFALAIACDAPILIGDNVLARAAELGWTSEMQP